MRERYGKDELNITQQKIINLISENPRITAAAIARSLSIGTRTVEKNIKLFKDLDILERIGGRKMGYWEIKG